MRMKLRVSEGVSDEHESEGVSDERKRRSVNLTLKNTKNKAFEKKFFKRFLFSDRTSTFGVPFLFSNRAGERE